MRFLLTTLFVTFYGLLFSQVIPTVQSSKSQQDFQEVRAEVNDFGTTGLTVRYHTGTFTALADQVEGQTWQHIALPGYQLTRDAGKPQLPVFGEMIMVPEGATFDWDYSYTSSQVYPGYRAYPALAPATDRYGDPEPQFAFDPATYSTNAFWPASPVTIAGTQELRGVQIVWFDITPVRFNPVTGELLVMEEVTLNIRFNGAASFMNYPLHSEEYLRNFPLTSCNSASIAREIVHHLGIESLNSTPPAPAANYIILTDSLFIDAANKMADWKRRLGYTAEVVAGSGWTHLTMKTAVHTRYQQWIPKPDYLLVIGDHDRMPAQMVLNPDNETFGTDLHLVTMGGASDHVPEMAKGRISASSAAQAMTIVDKIINYEKNPPTDSAFYQTGLNCAQFQDDNYDSYADRRFVHTSEEVRDYLTTKGYDIKRVYSADLTNSIPLYYNLNYYSNGQSLPASLLSSTFNWGGNASNIASYINAGAFYVLHRDHGYAGGTGWHAPYFVTSNVNNLNNGNKTPVVFSINCHTGEFTLPECFAERFQRHATGGAVGVVAASYYSYSGWNDGFTAGMFDAIWSSPGLAPAFGSGGISVTMLTPHPDIRNMGYVMNHGLLRMTQTWSTVLQEARYTYRLFHYFGDPSMRIRTTTPAQIAAVHQDSMTCTTSQFPVTGSSYGSALATLALPGRIIGKTTLVNGSGSIPVAPFSSPFLLLTLSGPEHIPYIDTIWVIPTPMSVAVTSQNVRCKGASEGEISLDITCGVQPFAITWSHGPTVPLLSQINAGTYYFTVTDATNTTYSDSVVITEPALPLLVNGQVTNVGCYYGANGEVTLNISGGVAPYQYSWSNGLHTPAVTGLPAGNVSVTVTDQIGCKQIQTFQISQPMPLQVGADVQHDVTNNCTGQATALPIGGTPPYSYLWNDTAAQTTQTAVGLCPGLVRVYVTDDHGCITVKAFTLYNTSGIETPEVLGIEVFPNPVKGSELFVSLPAQYSGKELQVMLFSQMGQLVIQQKATPEDGKFTIRELPKTQGVYYLMILEESSGLQIMRSIVRL